MTKHGLTTDQIFDSKWVDSLVGCHLWINSRDESGYGKFRNGDFIMMAHRYSYERSKGWIKHGLVIDHLCRVHHCINPEHLEAVTPQENTLRGTSRNRNKTHCHKGHEFTPDNTYIYPSGRKRKCLACRKA